MIQTQFGRSIKRLYSDNGKEYVNKNFSTFLKEHAISHELTCLDTPRQTGVAERKNRHLADVLTKSLRLSRINYILNKLGAYDLYAPT